MSKAFLDRNTGYVLRFTAALVIMLGHICPKGWYSFFFCSWLCVALFLFYSGYGTELAFETKKDYKQGFIIRKTAYVWIPYMIANTVYYLLKCIYGLVEFQAVDFVLVLCGLKLANSVLWYIIEVMILYAMCMIAHIIHVKIEVFWVVTYVIYMLVAVYYDIGTWWYISTLAFPMGVFAARGLLDAKPSKFMKWVILCSFFALYTIHYLVPYCGLVSDAGLFSKNHVIVAFDLVLTPLSIYVVSFLCLKIGRINAHNMLGSISFPLYLYHMPIWLMVSRLFTEQIGIIMATALFSFAFAVIYALIKTYMEKRLNVWAR